MGAGCDSASVCPQSLGAPHYHPRFLYRLPKTRLGSWIANAYLKGQNPLDPTIEDDKEIW
jgi:hypothetical protein